MTPLRQGGMVDLVFGDQERRAARVREVGHQYAILVPFGVAAEEQSEREAAIETLGPDGLLRLHGAVRAAGDGRLRFDPFRPYAELQRRQWPRIPTRRRVLIERWDGTAYAGVALDLSGGGMRVQTARGLQPGEDVRVLLSWAGDADPVGGHATVVRDDGGGIVAVRFGEWPEHSTRRLHELLAEPVGVTE